MPFTTLRYVVAQRFPKTFRKVYVAIHFFFALCIQSCAFYTGSRDGILSAWSISSAEGVVDLEGGNQYDAICGVKSGSEELSSEEEDNKMVVDEEEMARAQEEDKESLTSDRQKRRKI